EDDRPKKRSSRDDEDDEDDRPRKRSSRDDDDDDRPRKRSSRDEDDDEDEAPRRSSAIRDSKPSSRYKDEEEEERPSRSRKGRDDDEDDNRFRKPKKKAGGSWLPLILGISGGVVGLLLVGGLIWWMCSGSGAGPLTAWVPGDADAFFSIRVADLMNNS